jgi:hypothetical protein
MNVKRIFFVTTILLLLFAIGTASASNITDDTTITSDNTDTIVATDIDATNSISNDNTVTDTATKDNNNKNIEVNDVEKQQKSENDENNIPTVKNEKNLKTDGEPTVIDVTEDNFYDYFSYNNDGGVFRLNEANLPDVVVYNVYYFPSSLDISRVFFFVPKYDGSNE